MKKNDAHFAYCSADRCSARAPTDFPKRATRVAPKEQATNARLSVARLSTGVSALETSMAYKSYIEKLRDPRWQRKRLEVMERAQFQCETCESAEKTLNVHHKLYRKGANPWEYADEELACLCEECHEAVTHLRVRLDEALAQLGGSGFEEVVGFAEGLMLMRRAEREPEAAVVIPTIGHASGVAASVSADERDAHDFFDEHCESIPGSFYRLTAGALLALFRETARARRVARGTPETGL